MRIKLDRTVVSIILSAYIFGCLVLMVHAGLMATESIQPKRVFQFHYTISVKNVPDNSRKIDVWIPLAKSTNYQEISNLKITSEYSYSIMTESEYGNRMLYIMVENDLPNVLRIKIQFDVLRKTVSDAIKVNNLSNHGKVEDLKKYLRPNKLVPIVGRIAEEAANVVTENMTASEKARAIYDYLTQTVSYDKSGEGWGRGDALYACDIRKGNCTDFHSLFIGMARASGIPARFVIGFPIDDFAPEGKVAGYHCWAEYFINNKGWIPVDISDAYKFPEKHDFFFGGLDADRVQFTIGRDIKLKPEIIEETLNYFIYPYVLMDGMPYTDIEKDFYFTNIITEN